MRSAGRKDLTREIKNTFGRFMGIMVIVALGVSFFAGLGATGIDMKLTGDAYFDRYDLMDIRVVSTYGLDQKDIRALRLAPGVRAVYPAYGIDALTVRNNQSYILKIHSLEEVNQPVLLSGRFPERGNEALVEQEFLQSQNLAVGDVFTIQSGKKKDIRGQLRTNTFRVTGAVASPYYVSQERGSGSIGSGIVDFYLFIPRENFSQTIYSEAFLQVESTDAALCFSDEYKNKIKEVVKAVEKIGDARVVSRYQDMINRAEGSLKQARSDLTARQLQARLALDEAENEWQQNLFLVNAAVFDQPLQQAQIDDSLREIDLREAQVRAGLREADAAAAQLDAEEMRARVTDRELLEQSDVLDAEEAELQRQESWLNTFGSPDSEQGNPEGIETVRMQILTGKDRMAAGRAQIEEGMAALAAGLKTLANARETLRQQKQSLEQNLLDIEAGRDALNDAQSALQSGAAETSRSRNQLEASAAEFTLTRARTEKELEEARGAIDSAQKELDDLDLPKWYVLDRDSNPGYASFSQDADKITAIGKVFPLIFFLVAALVSLTTMTRLVEERRGEIGTLKSLGYGNISIISKYVIYAAAPTLIGGALGGYIGMKTFPRLILNAYGMLYTIPAALTPVNYVYWATGVGIAFACTVMAAVISCLNELRETPASLMRPRPPKAGRRTFLESMGFFWKSLTFTQKVTVRNIIRYKKRFYMTVIGIAGCTALLLTGFGLKDSVSAIMTLQYREICHYNMSVSFQDSAKRKNLDEIESVMRSGGVSSSIKLYQKAMDADNPEYASDIKTQSVLLVTPEDSNALQRFITFQDRVSKEPLSLSEDGVIITEKLSSLLKLRVGDEIQIQDGDGAPVIARVTGVTENYMFHYIYLTKELYQNLFGEAAEYNEMYALLNQSGQGEAVTAEDKALAKEILDQKEVSSVTFTENSILSFNDVITSLNFVVFVLIVSAGALAFVVLLNLSGINISERVRELATIEVLGFYDKEVSAYVFRESALLTVIGALAGLGLGVALHLYILLTAETELIMFGRAINAISFVYALVLTFVFSACANLFSGGKLKKIHMVEALKSVE
ncbi:MAG: ABC transporter permease [Clostridiales bacterium]|jgi:putative ABC transport system permease protein|nr:ABC transporter permease [Clostridiales bacterium]